VNGSRADYHSKTQTQNMSLYGPTNQACASELGLTGATRKQNMTDDQKHTLTLIAIVMFSTYFSLLGLAKGAEYRGPIQRAISRYADSRNETPEVFTARMKRYAVAIEYAADAYPTRTLSRQTRVAMLIVTGGNESHFDRATCEDMTSTESNPAVGCWQRESDEPPRNVEEAAYMAMQDLVRAAHYCDARGFDAVEGGLALYATGKRCTWGPSTKRAESVRLLAGGL